MADKDDSVVSKELTPSEVIKFAYQVANNVNRLLTALTGCQELRIVFDNRSPISIPEGSAAFLMLEYILFYDSDETGWSTNIHPTVSEISGRMMVPSHALGLAEKVLKRCGFHHRKIMDEMDNKLSQAMECMKRARTIGVDV